MASHLTTERDGRVIVATLSNPPHGLMNAAMSQELAGLVGDVENDASVGAVVLTGAHESRFLAHYDVAELLALGRDAPAVSSGQAAVGVGVAAALDLLPGVSDALARTPAAGLVTLRRFHDTLSGIGRSGAVWIAALNGSAMGGGCELALACDLRIMADGQFALGQPEILLGIPPGGGGTQRLARLIGRARALELVLEGRPVEPAEAALIGLVNRVVAPERLREEAVATAQRLARRPREVVALTKRAVLEGGSLALEAGLRMEQAAFMATLGARPARKAMEAYVAEQERLGEVPAYDEATRARLVDGTFVDFSAD